MSNSTNASKSQTNDLEELRNWYHRRSQDFTSANYLKYIDDKKLLAKIEDGFMRFERSLQLEKEKLHREFERKLSLARVKAPNPKCSILNDYLTFNEKITHPAVRCVPVNKNSSPSVQFLRPNDFCEFSSESEEESGSDEDQNGGNEFTEINENAQTEHSFTIKKETAAEKAEGENVETNKNGVLFSMTLASDSNFCTSTPIKKQQKVSNSPKSAIISSLGNEEITNEFESCFFKWLRYFTNFEDKLRREISAFENDQTKKEFRIELSRTIANRINDGAKKNVSSHEMGWLFNFFDDLLACRPVDSWREGDKFSLLHGDKAQQLFAMEKICTRYLEQIKWDNELMEHILLVLVKLCKKSNNFYKIFCTKVVNSVVLLSMDQDKIISKIVGFGNDQPQEAVVQWINNEMVVFRLFCRVQYALKSLHDDATPEKTQGFVLLREMFISVAECRKPVVLSSAFILSELLQFAKLFNSKQSDEAPTILSERFIPSIKNKIIDREWRHFLSDQNMKRLDECAEKALSARHSYLIDYLQNSIEKFNH
ncbi:hypothetical protein niasHT_015340 [Heterodera trifolii]|uniref:Uncharacterized protein n=1 Tax=Heterodera trifolii TaxID=157864 RepID=A0ABD2KZT4_9BILA